MLSCTISFKQQCTFLLLFILLHCFDVQIVGSDEDSHWQQLPFPPNVLALLPASTVAEMQTIQNNLNLTIYEKAAQIDQIMAQQPDEVLDKIPEPPMFANLPTNVKNHIKQIFRQKGKSLEAKQHELDEYVKNLPMDQQQAIIKPPNLPLIPPKFQQIIPSDTFAKIEAIQRNQSLSMQEKLEQIDGLFSALPATILDKIPDPPTFAQLPENVKNHLNEIKRQKGKSYNEKNKEYMAYVKTLPEEQQKIILFAQK